ncbi:MAG: type II toxin-antitoxin system ParD family antitoxin [Rhodanobacteraceae bacterium]|jgi:antitoxin ParD1/3/4|nr:type II toxin-antitoxin system ParD family antitoxin [Rhodanobacteraceae bacterium]
MPTSVALGEHFEAFVKRQLAEGRYNNASEVVRAGLRLLEDAEREKALELKALRAALKAGIDSGVGHDADAVFDRLEAKYRARSVRT